MSADFVNVGWCRIWRRVAVPEDPPRGPYWMTAPLLVSEIGSSSSSARNVTIIHNQLLPQTLDTSVTTIPWLLYYHITFSLSTRKLYHFSLHNLIALLSGLFFDRLHLFWCSTSEICWSWFTHRTFWKCRISTHRCFYLRYKLLSLCITLLYISLIVLILPSSYLFFYNIN